MALWLHGSILTDFACDYSAAEQRAAECRREFASNLLLSVIARRFLTACVAITGDRYHARGALCAVEIGAGAGGCGVPEAEEEAQQRDEAAAGAAGEPRGGQRGG